jgi:hypothetical protein
MNDPRDNVHICKVIDWYKDKYPHIESNEPSIASLASISIWTSHILDPLEKQFGEIKITYGFTSPQLLKEIKKFNPKGIAPNLDQHAAHENNAKGKPHCGRLGVACDIEVPEYKTQMDHVASWISINLEYDRLYFYGPDRPIHISVGPDNSKFIQIMGTSKTGKRVPKRNGINVPFSNLWER